MRLHETLVATVETTEQALHDDLGRFQCDGLDQYGFLLQVTGSHLVRVNGIDAVPMPGDLQFVEMVQEGFSSLPMDGGLNRHILDFRLRHVKAFAGRRRWKQ